MRDASLETLRCSFTVDFFMNDIQLSVIQQQTRKQYIAASRENKEHSKLLSFLVHNCCWKFPRKWIHGLNENGIYIAEHI